MKITLSLIIFVLGFGLGLYFGFKKAPEEFIYWNSQFNASILSHELDSLKNDNAIENISWSKEVELDYELSNYGRHLESNFGWVFPLITNIETDPKYINKAINYRLENPFSTDEISLTEGWASPNEPKTKALIKKMTEGQKENKRLLNMVLKTHASK